jgi:hypothetical protein
MGISWIAGGIPLGFTAEILPGSTLTTAGLLDVFAKAGVPAKTAGDIPINDNNFRLLTFIMELPPMFRSHPVRRSEYARRAVHGSRVRERENKTRLLQFLGNNQRLLRSGAFK